MRRSPHGSVNWNRLLSKRIFSPDSRSPHGSVNWNILDRTLIKTSSVAPRTGAWIEIICFSAVVELPVCRSPHGSVNWHKQVRKAKIKRKVAPRTGAWIEIIFSTILNLLIMSLPARERELKSCSHKKRFSPEYVAPRTGAWIEISINLSIVGLCFVAPRTGAWIEIIRRWEKWQEDLGRSPHGSVNWNRKQSILEIKKDWSLPARERELKSLK